MNENIIKWYMQNLKKTTTSEYEPAHECRY